MMSWMADANDKAGETFFLSPPFFLNLGKWVTSVSFFFLFPVSRNKTLIFFNFIKYRVSYNFFTIKMKYWDVRYIIDAMNDGGGSTGCQKLW